MKELRIEKDCVIIETAIPFKEGMEPRFREHPYYHHISSNRRMLMGALEERKDHCYNELVVNSQNIISNDGIYIVFTIEGETKSFNLPSYEAMKDAIKKLAQQDYDHFTKLEFDQMFKAVLKTKIDHSSFDNYDKLLMHLYEGACLTK